MTDENNFLMSDEAGRTQSVKPKLNPFFHNVKTIIESQNNFRNFVGAQGTCNEIQVSFQYAATLLQEYGSKSKDVFLSTFSVISLQKEMDRSMKDLGDVKEEVDKYFAILKERESNNHKTLQVLKDISNKLIHLRDENFLISKATKQSIQNILSKCQKVWSTNESTLEATRIADIVAYQQENIHGDMLTRMKKLEYHHSMSREITTLHLSFSRLLITIAFPPMTIKYCFMQKPISSINDFEPTLQVILTKMIEVGCRILGEVQQLAYALEVTRSRQEFLQSELERRKQIMFQTLIQLQKIFMEITNLDDQHDTLIGKMVKSRPHYAYLSQEIDNVPVPEVCNFTHLSTFIPNPVNVSGDSKSRTSTLKTNKHGKPFAPPTIVRPSKLSKSNSVMVSIDDQGNVDRLTQVESPLIKLSDDTEARPSGRNGNTAVYRVDPNTIKSEGPSSSANDDLSSASVIGPREITDSSTKEAVYKKSST